MNYLHVCLKTRLIPRKNKWKEQSKQHGSIHAVLNVYPKVGHTDTQNNKGVQLTARIKDHDTSSCPGKSIHLHQQVRNVDRMLGDVPKFHANVAANN